MEVPYKEIIPIWMVAIPTLLALMTWAMTCFYVKPITHSNWKGFLAGVPVFLSGAFFLSMLSLTEINPSAAALTPTAEQVGNTYEGTRMGELGMRKSMAN